MKGQELPPYSALTVTVPGAPGLWEDAVQRFGKLSLAQVSASEPQQADLLSLQQLAAGSAQDLLTQPLAQGCLVLLPAIL